MNKMMKVALTGMLALGLCGGTLAFGQAWGHDRDSRWGWQNGRWGWQDDHDRDDRDRDRDRDRDHDRDRDRRDRDRDRGRNGGYYGYPNGPYGNGPYNNGRWGNGRYSQNQAYNIGFQDGMGYGQRDRASGRRPTPTSSGYYANATRGYNPAYGDKNGYKEQYRAGYRDGYMRAYGSGYGRY